MKKDANAMAEEIDAVRREMEERGLTQRELADLAGISESAVSRILSGERRIGVYAKARIARALNKEIREVWPSLTKIRRLPPAEPCDHTWHVCPDTFYSAVLGIFDVCCRCGARRKHQTCARAAEDAAKERGA